MAEIGISEDLHLGPAVTSHAGPAAPAEAKFSNVSVTGKIESAGEFLWSEDIGFPMIALPKE